MINKHNKNIIDSYVNKILISKPYIVYAEHYLILLKFQCYTWDVYFCINNLCKCFKEND